MIENETHTKHKKNYNKFIAIGGIIIILILTYFYFFTGTGKEVASYTTSPIEKGDIANSISESGTISSSSLYEVTSSVSGVVKEIYVSNGDAVSKDQQLFKVDSIATDEEIATAYSNYITAKNSLNEAKQKGTTYEANIESAKKSVYMAQDKVDDKNDNPDKYSENEKNALESDLSIAKLNLAKADNDYNNLGNEIASAQAKYNASWYSYDQLTSGIVKAPVAGTVTNFSLVVGQEVSGSSNGSSTSSTSSSSTSSGSSVLMLKQSGDVTVDISINEVDLDKIKIGQKATITLDAISDKDYEGEVYAIDDVGSSDSGLVLFDVHTKITNADDKIKPAMSATVDIETEKAEGILMISNDYIQTFNNQQYVLKYNSQTGEVAKTNIETGLVGDTYTEITSGLNEGDIVALEHKTATTSSSSSNSGSGFSLGGGIMDGGQGGPPAQN